jgi:hypothetical protein
MQIAGVGVRQGITDTYGCDRRLKRAMHGKVCGCFAFNARHWLGGTVVQPASMLMREYVMTCSHRRALAMHSHSQTMLEFSSPLYGQYWYHSECCHG